MFKTEMLDSTCLMECGTFKAEEWRPSYKEFMALKLSGELEEQKTIKFESFGILYNNAKESKIQVNGQEYFLKSQGVSLIVKGTTVQLPQGSYNMMVCLENEEQNIEFC